MLPKILTVFKLIILSSNALPVEIATGINIAYSVAESVFHKIEMNNLMFMMQDLIRIGVDDKISEEDKEQCDLIIHAATKVMRCAKEEQIKRINDILCAAIDGDISYNSSEDYINVVDELRENEAICLVCIYKHMHEHPNADGFEGYDNPALEIIDEDDRVYLVNRLIGKGLLQVENDSTWGAVVEDKGETKVKVAAHVFTFHTTRFGEKLFKSLNTRE